MVKRPFPHLLRLFGMLAVCASLALAGTAQAGQRTCATATVPEPFVLPDGSEHAAGSLRLCRLQQHYPSTTLFVGYVDGQNVGLLLGAAGHNEIGPGADPFMIFARDPDGRLRLYGYGLHQGSDVATYTAHRPDRPRATVRVIAS